MLNLRKSLQIEYKYVGVFDSNKLINSGLFDIDWINVLSSIYCTFTVDIPRDPSGGMGNPGHKPGGSDTAGPAHNCVGCRLNVHTICSMSWDDPNASFGEGHKCFECAGTQQPPLVPPPPDAAATSPRQPQDQQ